MTSPDDQTLRLLAGLDLADQGQLIDIESTADETSNDRWRSAWTETAGISR